MRYGLVASLALAACVARESGNPAPRCDDQLDCALEQACYRGFCIDQDPPSVDAATRTDGGEKIVDTCKKCIEQGPENPCGEPHKGKSKGSRCGPRCDDVMCGGRP